jgi:hypothetical protein
MRRDRQVVFITGNAVFGPDTTIGDLRVFDARADAMRHVGGVSTRIMARVVIPDSDRGRYRNPKPAKRAGGRKR